MTEQEKHTNQIKKELCIKTISGMLKMSKLPTTKENIKKCLLFNPKWWKLSMDDKERFEKAIKTIYNELKTIR